MIYTQLVMLHTKWAQMSRGDQVRTTLNSMFDALLLWFFVYAIWLGVTYNPNEFAFVVPALGVALFFRFRLMRKRWAL